MDRNQAKQLLPVIQAFSEGKTIQYRIRGNESAIWSDITKNYHDFSPHSFMYRIKPEYRPFANAEECLAEMQKHQLFGWVKDRDGNKVFIGGINSDNTIFMCNSEILYLKDTFEDFTFIDGTPFGIKEEE